MPGGLRVARCRRRFAIDHASTSTSVTAAAERHCKRPSMSLSGGLRDSPAADMISPPLVAIESRPQDVGPAENRARRARRERSHAPLSTPRTMTVADKPRVTAGELATGAGASAPGSVGADQPLHN